ncbi:MAG: hypothetical protein MHMPM18_004468 [Marteilia pararefringens]
MNSLSPTPKTNLSDLIMMNSKQYFKFFDNFFSILQKKLFRLDSLDLVMYQTTMAWPFRSLNSAKMRKFHLTLSVTNSTICICLTQSLTNYVFLYFQYFINDFLSNIYQEKTKLPSTREELNSLSIKELMRQTRLRNLKLSASVKEKQEIIETILLDCDKQSDL